MSLLLLLINTRERISISRGILSVYMRNQIDVILQHDFRERVSQWQVPIYPITGKVVYIKNCLIVSTYEFMSNCCSLTIHLIYIYWFYMFAMEILAGVMIYSIRCCSRIAASLITRCTCG
jgi:hypothetical protein